VAVSYSTFIPDANIKDQYRGDKRYELDNHLGNVLAVVSDRRTPEYSLGTFSKFNAIVVSAQDYYSFGMIQPGRSFGSTVYPFGYNAGSEKDDEISGVTGSHYYTLFRELDTRIGRWWAIDPKTTLTPWESPYVSMGNSPIFSNDPLGDVQTKYWDKEDPSKLIEDVDDGIDQSVTVDRNYYNQMKGIVTKGGADIKNNQSDALKFNTALKTFAKNGQYNMVGNWPTINNVLEGKEWYQFDGICGRSARKQANIGGSNPQHEGGQVNTYVANQPKLTVNIPLAIKIVQSELNGGFPVMAGVNVQGGFNSDNRNNSTTHFVNIAGQGNNGFGNYWSFVDNAYRGNDVEINRLYFNNANNSFKTLDGYFRLTEVRPQY